MIVCGVSLLMVFLTWIFSSRPTEQIELKWASDELEENITICCL